MPELTRVGPRQHLVHNHTSRVINREAPWVGLCGAVFKPHKMTEDPDLAHCLDCLVIHEELLLAEIQALEDDRSKVVIRLHAYHLEHPHD